MKNHASCSWLCVVMVACAWILARDPGTAFAAPPAIAPATRAAPATDWDLLLKQLASDHFDQREAAQKQLEHVDFRERGKLEQLAASTQDPEVKLRLAQGLEAVDLRMGLNPPSISVELKNATLDQVYAELSRALGITLQPPARAKPDASGETYTLSMHDRSFWEVLQALSAQHGLWYSSYSGPGPVIYRRDPGIRQFSASGAAVVFPDRITPSANAANAALPDGASLMTMMYMVAIDPRVNGLRIARPSLISIVDDAGNTLTEREPRGPTDRASMAGLPPAIQLFRADLIVPADHGKKIASLKGEVKFSFQLAQEKVEFRDVQQVIGKPVTVAGESATIEQFSPRTETEFNISISHNTPAVARGGPPQPPRNYATGVRVVLIDAAGQRLVDDIIVGRMGGSTITRPVTYPVRAEFSVATKFKETWVPFELKDLPLP